MKADSLADLVKNSRETPPRTCSAYERTSRQVIRPPHKKPPAISTKTECESRGFRRGVCEQRISRPPIPRYRPDTIGLIDIDFTPMMSSLHRRQSHWISEGTKYGRNRRIYGTTAVCSSNHEVALVSNPGSDFQIVEREIPMPGVGHVRIKVQACGVCHSDVLTKEGYWPSIRTPAFRTAKSAGIIDELGPGVSGVEEGAACCVSAGTAARTARVAECRRGDFRNCRNLKKLPASAMTADTSNTWWLPWKHSWRYRTVSATSTQHRCSALGLPPSTPCGHSGAFPGDLAAVQGIGRPRSPRHSNSPISWLSGGRCRGAGLRARRSQSNSERGCISTAKRPTRQMNCKSWRRQGNPGHGSEFESNVRVDRWSGTERQAPRCRCDIRSHGGRARAAHRWKQGNAGLGCGNTADSDDTLSFAELSGVRPMIEPIPWKEWPKRTTRMMSGKAQFRVV